MKETLLATLLCLACSGGTAAQPADEVALARSVLRAAQARSVRENREFCGYIAYDGGNRLVSTDATRGERDGCSPPWSAVLRVVPSWHTHAAFDAGAWSEVPTVLDIEADEDEGIDGYVATPGGRLWFIDTQTMIVRQICGPGCLPADPRFAPGSEGVIRRSYSYGALRRREVPAG